MSITFLSAGIFALTLVGGLAPRRFASRLSEQRLHDVTGWASGLLLGSALLVVIPEGFDVAAGGGGPEFTDRPAVLGSAVLIGFLVMLLLEGLGVAHAVHEEHHDHEEGHGHGHIHHPTSTGILAIGLSIHAVADGLAIGAAAVSGDETFSLLVALAVVLHRIPAAFSLGLFSAHETKNPRASMAGVIGFAVATPIAILISYVLLDGASDRLVALTLLFSAGTFVYVATVDTLPEIHNPETGRRSVMNVMLGAGLFAAAFLAADAAGWLEHGHGDQIEHHHELEEDPHDE